MVLYLLSFLYNNYIKIVKIVGLIKFFGNVSQLRPRETFQDYPKVVETIFRSTNESDPSLVCVALETVGYIATTPSGKLTLHKQGM